MIGFRHFFTDIQEGNNKFSSSPTGRQKEIMQEYIPLIGGESHNRFQFQRLLILIFIPLESAVYSSTTQLVHCQVPQPTNFQ